MSEILVILGHPEADSYCGALADAYAEGARATGASVRMLRLGELELDLVLRREGQAEEPDLLAARQAIADAAHIAWAFPMWWVGPPALLKGFVDRALTSGWAYRYDERGLPEGLLKGRSSRTIVTMDSPSWWYFLWYRRALRISFDRGTLQFCGMTPVRRTIVYGVRTLDEAKRAAWLERAREAGAQDARAVQARTPRLSAEGVPA